MAARLSQSALWQRLKQYYQEVSLKAWEVGATPHYVTNNPYIARAYAAAIRAAARDFGEPVTVVELGAGTGRLAFHLVKRLEGCSEVSGYLLTDVVPKNVDFWRAHPRLVPFFDKGFLEARILDVEAPTRPLRGPVVFLANYLFDSLPQDAFRDDRGVLEESRVVEKDGPGSGFASLRLEYEHGPASFPYYDEPVWDKVLEGYRGCGGCFLLPVGGLRCLDTLRELSGARMLLLTADKAWTSLSEFEGRPEFQPALHGSFSFPANYHALQLAVEARGGSAWHARRRPVDLQVSAFSFGPLGTQLQETLHREFEELGPADFYRLQGMAYDADLSCEQALSLLHLSGYDPELVFSLGKALSRADSPRLRREAAEALERCHDNYYWLGPDLERDLPFELASVYRELELWEPAIAMFEQSLTLFGEQKATFHQIGLCHRGQGDAAAANHWFSKALDLEREASPMLDFFSTIFGTE